MTDFDTDDCLRRYRALAARQPALFDNPAGPVYQILATPDEIKAAQGAAHSYRLAHRLPAADMRVGVIAEDPYMFAMRDPVRFPDGALGLYNRLLIPPGVVVLPIHNGRVALIYRFRHGPRTFVYEVPRGMVPEGASFEDAARMELQEEIGATASSLIPLGSYYPNTGVASETMHLFAARIDGVGAADRHEAIVRIEQVTVDEVEAMIRGGTITDASTLVIYLRAKLSGLV
jgi:ADP-ribose pyrophosphatase